MLQELVVHLVMSNLTSGVSVYCLTQISWALALKVTNTAAAEIASSKWELVSSRTPEMDCWSSNIEGDTSEVNIGGKSLHSSYSSDIRHRLWVIERSSPHYQ